MPLICGFLPGPSKKDLYIFLIYQVYLCISWAGVLISYYALNSTSVLLKWIIFLFLVTNFLFSLVS